MTVPKHKCIVGITVPSKVQNLRKMRNFGQNFSIFFKLVDGKGDYCKNLNQSVQYLMQNRSLKQ